MAHPSFFIVGAPKCGTTALCKYLSQHPDVFLSTPKELNYFDTDFQTKKSAHSLAEYLEKLQSGDILEEASDMLTDTDEDEVDVASEELDLPIGQFNGDRPESAVNPGPENEPKEMEEEWDDSFSSEIVEA